MEKQPCNRLRKEHKRSGYDQSPYSENTKGNVVAMADTIVFLCTVILCSKSIQAEAKPSAVFQDTDSICPPTRWVAMAAAPNAETILVRIMEIMQ